MEITAGAVLLLAVLFYLDESWLLIRAIPACALHELGHWAALRMLGGRVRCLRISAVGAELQLTEQGRISYPGEVLAAFAGPGVNLMLAFLCAGRAPVFSGINLVLGLFNLLPVMPLDGGRILYYLLAVLFDEGRALRASEVWSGLLGAAAVLVGGVLLWMSGSNFTLLLVALWLNLCRMRKKSCQSTKKWLK